MTIYLTQGGDDETKVDEIEDKLKSTIPDLKRISRVEDIDQKSVSGPDRSIVLLVAAIPGHTNVDDLIDVVRPIRGTCSSSLLAATFPPATIKGSFNPATPTGSPRSDCRKKFSTLSAESALPRERMSLLNRLSSFRSRRAREASAIPPSRSKPLSTWSKTSQTRALRVRLKTVIRELFA
jgi:hypothetical protein